MWADIIVAFRFSAPHSCVDELSRPPSGVRLPWHTSSSVYGEGCQVYNALCLGDQNGNTR